MHALLKKRMLKLHYLKCGHLFSVWQLNVPRDCPTTEQWQETLFVALLVSQRVEEVSKDTIILPLACFPTQWSWRGVTEKWRRGFLKNVQDTTEEVVHYSLICEIILILTRILPCRGSRFQESVLITAQKEISYTDQQNRIAPSETLMNVSGIDYRICTTEFALQPRGKGDESQTDSRTSGYSCVKDWLQSFLPPSVKWGLKS